MKKFSVALTTLFVALSSASLQAKTLWSDNSISLLYGTNYELVPDNTLTTMTLEHVSGHTWGGLFFFVDRHHGKAPATGDKPDRTRQMYGELSPKFHIAKFQSGLVKAVNLAGTYEFGGNLDNLLVGLGLDFNIPGMKYASLSLYQAFNDSAFNTVNDKQVTVTYGWTGNNVTLDGYIDYSFDNDKSEDQFHFNPQLKYNVGSLFNTSKKIDAGIEYSYWKNKFGIKDKNQSVVSAIVKAHF